MQQFLKSNGVLLKDFREYVQNTSNRLKEASLAEARQQQRPVVYMRSPEARPSGLEDAEKAKK